MSPSRALGVGPPTLGDGPYIEILPHLSDGNRNWDSFLYDQALPGAGPYIYRSFSTSVLGAAAQNSARWWYRDFGEGGTFEFKAIHTTGDDVGIYSFLIDGREVGRLDGYSSSDVNNVETTVARGIRIGPGRHRIEIVIVGANPAATGLKFYPALSALFFRRTGVGARLGPFRFPAGRPVSSGGQVIDIMPLMATGHSGWANFLATQQMAYGYELYSNNAAGNSRWWDLGLGSGTWAIDLRMATFSSAGVISIQIDGVTVATINGFSGGTVYGVHKSTTFAVPSSGTHRLALTMVAGGYGDISSVQLRQLTGRPMPHRLHNWSAFWSSGHVNWNNLVAAFASYLYDAELDSTGAQNAAIWWDKDLAAGTWDFEMIHSKGVNRGIYSVRIDGVEVGTIDGYNGSLSLNNQTIITGIKIPFSGTHRISLVMATRNPSNTATPGYFGTVTAFQLRRTGA